MKELKIEITLTKITLTKLFIKYSMNNNIYKDLNQVISEVANNFIFFYEISNSDEAEKLFNFMENFYKSFKCSDPTILLRELKKYLSQHLN
jgi:hypothetical protein